MGGHGWDILYERKINKKKKKGKTQLSFRDSAITSGDIHDY